MTDTKKTTTKRLFEGMPPPPVKARKLTIVPKQARLEEENKKLKAEIESLKRTGAVLRKALDQNMTDNEELTRLFLKLSDENVEVATLLRQANAELAKIKGTPPPLLFYP